MTSDPAAATTQTGAQPSVTSVPGDPSVSIAPRVPSCPSPPRDPIAPSSPRVPGAPSFPSPPGVPSVPSPLSPPSCLWTLGELPGLAAPPLAPLAHRSFVPALRFSVINLQQLGHEDLLELERVNPPLLTTAQRSAPTNKRHVYASRDLSFLSRFHSGSPADVSLHRRNKRSCDEVRLNQSEMVSPTCNHVTVEE